MPTDAQIENKLPKIFLCDMERITVSPERQRKDFGDIDALAQSIKDVGQIQPIVLDENGVLIAGERRYRAVKKLGYKYILSIRLIDLTQPEKYEIELEENVRRKQLEDKEYFDALLQLHQLKTANNTGPKRGVLPIPPRIVDRETGQKIAVEGAKRHTLKDTAELVGVSEATASRDLKIAKLLSVLPEKIRESVILACGGNKTKILAEIEKRLTLGIKVDNQQKAAKKFLNESDSTVLAQMVKHMDCRKGIKDIPTESVGLILTDIPYARLDTAWITRKKGVSENEHNWDESNTSVMDLMAELIPQLFRVAARPSHMYMFCPLSIVDFDTPYADVNFLSIGQMLKEAGFSVRGMPLIWSKTKGQMAKAPGVHWPIGYETIIFASKGKMPQQYVHRSDVLAVDQLHGSEKEHINHKPPGVWEPMIKTSKIEGSLCLDPFCGTGENLALVYEHGMIPLGFDLDEKNVAIARRNIKKAMEAKNNPTTEGGEKDAKIEPSSE